MRKRLFILPCQPILRKINFCFLIRHQQIFGLLYLNLNFLISPDDIRLFVSKILHGDIFLYSHDDHSIIHQELFFPHILQDEYIGDILIDTFGDEMCILEQYEDELKKAVK